MGPEVRDKLPVHPGGRKTGPHILRVDGLVGRPLQLTMTDLEGLARQKLTDDFTCLEGWTVPALKWGGVALAAVLALAQAHPEAQWVQASAGDFSVPIPIKEATRALLATRLGDEDEELPVEHGGPVRLVLPGSDCFTSIKWLDHLELRREAGDNTGKNIALGRLRTNS